LHHRFGEEHDDDSIRSKQHGEDGSVFAIEDIILRVLSNILCRLHCVLRALILHALPIPPSLSVSMESIDSTPPFSSKELDPLSLARDFWLNFYSFLLVLDYRSTTPYGKVVPTDYLLV
jgi:hypothetical protein